MNRQQLLIRLHLCLLVILVLYSLWGYLTQWEQGWLEYWLLPATAVILGLGMLVVLKYPHLSNFPQKKQVRRWPAERRTVIYDKINEMLLLVVLHTDMVFLAIQIDMLTPPPGPGAMAIAVLVVVELTMLIVVLVYLARISQIVDRMEKELVAAGWSPEEETVR